jgi:hypothetical protein
MTAIIDRYDNKNKCGSNFTLLKGYLLNGKAGHVFNMVFIRNEVKQKGG